MPGEQSSVEDLLAAIRYDAELENQVADLVLVLQPDLVRAGIHFAEPTMQDPELKEETIRFRSSIAHNDARHLKGRPLTEEEAGEIDEQLATVLLEESANSIHLRSVASTLALAKNAEASDATVVSRLMTKKLMQAYTLALGLNAAWLVVIDKHFPGNPLTEADGDYVQALKDELIERQRERDEYLNTMGSAAIPILSEQLNKAELSELDFDILATVLGSWHDMGKHKTDGDIQSWLDILRARLVEHGINRIEVWMHYARSLTKN